jgi:uncharacterized protein (TIGR04376 family)
MGIFEDFNRFLETRLEEFLRNNPQLELQALEEQLREQEEDTQRLVVELHNQEKQLQAEILNIAQDIQRWHSRIAKAQAADRQDLAQAAREREAALLRQGNQRWGQMEGLKARIKQTEALQHQIQARRQEVQEKVAQAETAARARAAQPRETTSGWYQSNIYSEPDPLEEQFRRWETEEELEQLKRKMGR